MSTSQPFSKEAVSSIVEKSVLAFAAGFQARHESEVADPEGTINLKIHNVFVEALGDEVRYYSALARSLDSSLGNTLEKMAINIARLSFDVHEYVEGPLSARQTGKIAELLDQYKSRTKVPSVEDYQELRELADATPSQIKRHVSDYHLIDRETGERYLVELKIGGDLDNKKAKSEKDALLEQFAILTNTVGPDVDVQIFFATAYNRFGEDKPWRQERVRQFFAAKELLIGRDFWNFVCRSEEGYEAVLRAYQEHSHHIRDALASIRATYLK